MNRNLHLTAVFLQTRKRCEVMPIDYVPVGKLKPTKSDPNPLQSRRNHIRCLYRGPPEGLNAAISGTSDDELDKKMQQLRLAAHKFGVALRDSVLINGLSANYPHLRCNGQPIRTVDDFDNWIKTGKWNKEKKEVLACACVHVWGENNQ